MTTGECDHHPKLTDREAHALLVLADEKDPISGHVLAKKMSAAGRNTTKVAAYQAANALQRKGMAYRYQPFDSVPPKFGATDDGRAQVTS